MDESGGVVAGAQVTLHNTGTNASRDQMTTAEGLYVFSAVEPGNYVLTVARKGFQRVSVTALTFNINKSYTQDVSLKVGTSATIVVVTSEPALELQTTDATIGNVIAGQYILRLPMQGRNVTRLLYLQPEATPLHSGRTMPMIAGRIKDRIPHDAKHDENIPNGVIAESQKFYIDLAHASFPHPMAALLKFVLPITCSLGPTIPSKPSNSLLMCCQTSDSRPSHANHWRENTELVFPAFESAAEKELSRGSASITLESLCVLVIASWML